MIGSSPDEFARLHASKLYAHRLAGSGEIVKCNGAQIVIRLNMRNRLSVRRNLYVANVGEGPEYFGSRLRPRARADHHNGDRYHRVAAQKEIHHISLPLIRRHQLKPLGRLVVEIVLLRPVGVVSPSNQPAGVERFGDDRDRGAGQGLLERGLRLPIRLIEME